MARNQAIVAAALALALAAGTAVAQVRQVQFGNTMDANPGVGTGGANVPIQGYVPVNGNNIITGNVAGLGYFHGPVAYSSQYQFQGNLPSSNLSGFARQSAGSGSQSVLSQPYYLPSSTVSSNQGGVYSAPMGGGFDSQIVPRTAVSPFASTVQLQALVPGQSSGRLPQSFNRIEAEEIPVKPGAPGALLNTSLFAMRVAELLPQDTSDSTKKASGEPGADDKLKGPMRGATVAEQAAGSLDPRLSGKTDELKGASLSPKEIKPEDLRIGDSYRTLLDELNKAETEATKEAGGPTAASPGGGSSELKGMNMAGQEYDPLTGTPRRTVYKKGSEPVDATAKPGKEAPVIVALPPKRLEELPQSVLQAGTRVTPIKTFVRTRPNGVTTQVDQLLARGEESLKQGKYMEAVEVYSSLLTKEPGNALALVGRAHAELGAGMYQSAAYDLKFVFTRNPSMVSVRYEAGTFLADSRQDYVTKDLSTLASNKDTADTASFLLCYVYYQLGRTQPLKAELDRWAGRAGHDNWPAVLKRAWQPAVPQGEPKP